jgi:vancomycin resistance protein YoaR
VASRRTCSPGSRLASVTDAPPPLKQDRRLLRWLLLGLLVLIGGAYVAAYLFTGDRIARGTTIAGVDVGGMKPDEAVSVVTDQLADEANRPIQLSVGDLEASRSADDLGLQVDAVASVEQVAVGRSWRPQHLWEYIAGGSSYEPVVTLDEGGFQAGFDTVVVKVDREAREGSIRFTKRGRAEPVYPEPGRTVDVDGAKQSLLAAYPLHTDQAVVVPVEVTDASISEAEVSRAMREFANPAMSAPVVFLVAGERVVVEPEDFAPALSMDAADGHLAPHVNKKRLLAAVQPAMKRIALAPRDASVAIVNGAPKIIPGKAGVTFDPDAITSSFLSLVVAQGNDRELAVKTEIATPEHTAAEIRELGIKEQVSEFTTYFPYAEYRNTNIGRGAELINGTILKPGETFSLNGVVGERTEENGFVKGFIISDGVFRQELGGGVSQVATTTFNAAFFAGLEDVEHKPHSFYISRYPVGREATVAWPTVDLKFTNNTPYGILIQAWRGLSTPTTQGSMNVRMWSTKFWKIKAGASAPYNYTTHKVRHLPPVNCEPNSGYSGFEIDVYRDFYKPGSDKRVRRETMHTSYTPSDTVICDG